MKLLIVDDDRQIREGIKEGIDWSALGIEEVATASNGLEALELFGRSFPEIVLTDVRMPGMDGLELLGRIKEMKASTKVVILSGFNDFEYLKKAIQLDAADYEMKPIRAGHLVRLIRKIKEDLVREQVSAEAFHSYLESRRDVFVEELLAGRMTDRLIVVEGLKQHFDFDARGTLICACLEIEGEAERTSSALQAAADRLQEERPFGKPESKDLLLRSGEGKLVLLVRPETSSYLYARQLIGELKNRLLACVRAAEAAAGLPAAAGISEPGNAAGISELLAQANEALAWKLYAGHSCAHAFEGSRKLLSSPIAGLLEQEEFKSQLRLAHRDRLLDMISGEFERLRQEQAHDAKSVQQYCANLIRLLMLLPASPSFVMSEWIERQLARLDGGYFVYLDDFKDMVLSAYEEACGSSAGAAPANRSALMQRADEYIREHYAQDLTVEKVAEHVGKTPNYFSHLFKKELGVPFREYVNRLRISKAKELILRTNDRIYEIGEKVGFSDYAYFTQVFRKLEGRPPTSLRKIPQDEERPSKKS